MILFLFFIFLINSLTIYLIVKYYSKSKYYNKISVREINHNSISNNAGISFFICYFFGGIFFYFFRDFFLFDLILPDYYFIFFSCILIIFILGSIDDIYDVPFTIKFLIQFIISSLIVLYCNVYVEDFYGVFNLYQIDYSYMKVFSIILVVFIINSYNLIDGVDGLAAINGIFIFSCYSFIFYFNSLYFEFLLSCLSIVILLSFLLFNKYPAKIFMGDRGSLLIGFVLSYLTLKACNLPIDIKGTINPVIVLCILAYPAVDTLRVFFVRIKSGKSPFLPDKNHLHHLMIDYGFSHFNVSVFAVFYSSVLVLICFYFRELQYFSFYLMVFLSLLFIYLFSRFIKK